jgi:large subunit ribosomal protein L10
MKESCLMARPEKINEVEAISERMKNAECMVFTDYTGIPVLAMTAFRRNCRAKGVDCRVVKNRLARIAATKHGMGDLSEHLKGPTAVLFGMESQVEAARIAVEFSKENEKLKIKGGFVDGRFLTPEQVVALSKVPSREQLLSMMMGSINAPARGLAVVTNGVAASLCRAIDAVAKQKAA